jgi:hypothetical protein
LEGAAETTLAAAMTRKDEIAANFIVVVEAKKIKEVEGS